MRHRRGLVLGALSLGCLVSCGGDEGNPPSPLPPTPSPPPLRTVVAQGSVTISAPDDEFSYFRTRLISTTAAGALETTVNWTYPANTVWMYIADGECTGEQFSNDDCPGGPTCACRFSVLSEASSPKPRVLTVSNASPGTRTLILWNLGPQEESCSYQSVLTSATAGSSPAGPGLASLDAGLGRKRRTAEGR